MRKYRRDHKDHLTRLTFTIELVFRPSFKMRSLQIYFCFSLIQFSQEFTTSSGPLAAIFHGPPLPERNFIPIWNSPTYSCQDKWNISLNLSQYGIVSNDENKWYGKFMNIFYANVGLWPYYDDEGLPVNNGLPQLGDLDSHLIKLAQDIKTVIPDEDFQGMAVLDLEYWRPVFDRNWDDKSIYRDQSMDLVYKEHPSWSADQIKKEARIQFESAAKRYMQSSILLGRKLRPKALWGYYGFPRCYNTRTFTFECSDLAKEQNDEITWLFESSSVVLPSIYISVKSEYDAQDYAKGNILEGFRMSNLSTGQRLPVFPYVRVVYAFSQIFLNKQDMYSTVSQSAELATSGVVIWGAHADETEEFCLQLQDYMDDFFGPLVVTLSLVTQECASEYCSSHGRCRFKLQPVVAYVKDVLLDLSLKKEWSFVECVCNMGWKGGHCDTPSL